MTFHLTRHEALDDGLRRIAKEQIGFALRDIDDADMPLDRKVHALRKRCKKLRGLLRLVRPVMGTAFETEDRRFREAAHLLASARDSSVRAAIVGDLGDDGDGSREPQPVVPPDELQGVRALFAVSLDAVGNWPFELHGFADIAPGFAQTYRKCVGAWAGIADAPTDADYHRLRKWAKYHWYHVRILERINRPELQRRRERLRKLQLHLGDAHDLAVLMADLSASSSPDEALLEKASARKRRLYAKAGRQARRLFSAPEEALVADVAQWWSRRH